MAEEYIKKSEVLMMIEEIKEDRDVPKNYGMLLDIMRQIREMEGIVLGNEEKGAAPFSFKEA